MLTKHGLNIYNTVITEHKTNCVYWIYNTDKISIETIRLFSNKSVTGDQPMFNTTLEKHKKIYVNKKT